MLGSVNHYPDAYSNLARLAALLKKNESDVYY